MGHLAISVTDSLQLTRNLETHIISGYTNNSLGVIAVTLFPLACLVYEDLGTPSVQFCCDSTTNHRRSLSVLFCYVLVGTTTAAIWRLDMNFDKTTATGQIRGFLFVRD